MRNLYKFYWNELQPCLNPSLLPISNTPWHEPNRVVNSAVFALSTKVSREEKRKIAFPISSRPEDRFPRNLFRMFRHLGSLSLHAAYFIQNVNLRISRSWLSAFLDRGAGRARARHCTQEMKIVAATAVWCRCCSTTATVHYCGAWSPKSFPAVPMGVLVQRGETATHTYTHTA